MSTGGPRTHHVLSRGSKPWLLPVASESHAFQPSESTLSCPFRRSLARPFGHRDLGARWGVRASSSPTPLALHLSLTLRCALRGQDRRCLRRRGRLRPSLCRFAPAFGSCDPDYPQISAPGAAHAVPSSSASALALPPRSLSPARTALPRLWRDCSRAVAGSPGTPTLRRRCAPAWASLRSSGGSRGRSLAMLASSPTAQEGSAPCGRASAASLPPHPPTGRIGKASLLGWPDDLARLGGSTRQPGLPLTPSPKRVAQQSPAWGSCSGRHKSENGESWGTHRAMFPVYQHPILGGPGDCSDWPASSP